jgi:tellurite resistance protein TehA-like permease
MKNAWFGNGLFLVGSLIFTFDASLEVVETCSIRSIIRLCACLSFTVGCFLLMPEPQQE